MDHAEDRLRLFTAVELPGEWLRGLQVASTRLREAGGDQFKWVRPELMHVTIVFLGSQDRAILPALTASLQNAATASRPFDLSLSRLGTFGPPHALTVIWAGLDGPSPQLLQLHENIGEELEGIRMTFDRKPLVPHITLARGRRPIEREASVRMASAIQRVHLPKLTARVEEFVLMASTLSPHGPSYEVIHRFPLGSPR